MGNKQSVTITPQKADHDGIQMNKDKANGHALSGLDLTDAVTCETSVQQKSEPAPPVTVTNKIKLTPTSVELNGTQAKTPTMSVEAANNNISTITISTETEDTSKQPEISSMFNKMFKNKSKPVPPASEADIAAEEAIVSAVETESQKSNPSLVSVEAKSIQSNTTVSVEAAVNQISATAESNTPAKDTPKQPEISSMFNKMFKKKTGPVSPASEEPIASSAESQKSNPSPASVEANGTQAKAAVSVEAAGNQISAIAESTDSNTPAKDRPKQPEISSRFNKMFKKKTGPVSLASEASVAAEELIVSAVEAVSQMSNPSPPSVEANGTQAKAAVSVEAAGNQISATAESTESNTPDSSKQPEISSMFNKMFKKKTEPVSPATKANGAAEEAVVSTVETQNQKCESTAIKANRPTEKVPQGESPSLSTTEVTQDSAQPEQDSIEEKSVMNFFKTFVSSTKTTKEATASPDVSKEQSKKETSPAPTANVPEASKLPPPPPPAPPKMESKAEPSVKKDEVPPIEVAASTAKQPETPSKSKTKNSSFSKLFRPKVDASKTSTLEAGAKAELPPAPKAEEKKAEKKSSPFANMLKPKVLLGQVSSKIHAAASSAAAGISLGAGGAVN